MQKIKNKTKQTNKQVIVNQRGFINLIALYRAARHQKYMYLFTHQGCGLIKIMRSPKVPNHEILGA